MSFSYVFTIENKKKVRKDSAKRKRSAKTRGNDKKIAKDQNEIKNAIHRKSYSEVLRDYSKQNNKLTGIDDKDMIVNSKNINLQSSTNNNKKLDFKITLSDQNNKQGYSKGFGPKFIAKSNIYQNNNSKLAGQK